jgi:spore coat polysaccharide biosynthesis protein SpsF
VKTVAIIQARMGSTRLPGKVLRRLCGQSVLAHVVARVKSSRRLDGVMIATTNSPADDAVVAECGKLKVPFFRGSEEDVLARYFGAAQAAGADVIVRVTSDCPLFDGALLDEMLEVFRGANADYLSNTLKRTFPRGLDAEIFTFAALESAHREAAKPHEREHVTPFFYGHPELFRLRSFEGAVDLSAHRWTLDTAEDWEFVRAIYDALAKGGRMFSTEDVLKLLKERPELTILNTHVEQKKSGG